MNSISYYTLQLSIWSIIIPLIVGSIYFKKLNKQSKLIYYLVVLATFPQVLTAFIAKTPILNSIYNIYTPMEFALTYFFIGNKFKAFFFQKASQLIVVLFIFLSLIFFVYDGIEKKVTNELICAANIFYLCWIFLYILESIINDEELLNVELPLFWYIIALFLYAPCTALVTAFDYYIGKSTNVLINNLWIIHDIFNSLLYIFFAIGLYKERFKNISLRPRISKTI